MKSQSPPTTSREGIAFVILAAGAGTRMKSALPKPLHPVAGVRMIDRLLRASRGANPVTTTIVASQALAERLGEISDVSVVLQEKPLGTGDAARSALPVVGEAGWMLTAFADHPLLTEASVGDFAARAKDSQALVTIFTCVVEHAQAYGRIARDADGRPIGIVEKTDDDPALRVGQVEVNSGIMLLRLPWASDALANLKPNPTRGEYFLTDLVALAVAEAQPGKPWPVATVAGDPDVIHGFNDRLELATVESMLRDRIRRRHMLNGVTIVAPETVFIDDDVVIGPDTTVLPYSMLEGQTVIGAGCRIGPQANLINASLGDRVIVRASTISNSTIASDSDVGPYAHVRGGTRVAEHVHIGSYAELKNANVEAHVKVGHVSYLGDANIGHHTNVGAGTVTCNYDGVNKHVTEIGPGVFIGSDTMLVAPVSLGEGALTGAGAVVTKDVEPWTKVAGVPARPIGLRHSNPARDEGE